MFWEEEATQNQIRLNSLEKLLSSKEDVSLEEILDDPFILQELRQNNPKVVEILTRDENIVQLAKNALQPTIDETLPLEQHYTLSNLSTEILTVSNVNEIIDTFLQNKDCMGILSAALDDPTKFNSVVAIFYSKIFATIMSKNFAATLAFMKETNFLERSRNFLKFGAIADLLECLIRLNNGEEEIHALREYLVEEKFIPSLVSLLDPSVNVAIQENAADVFIDLLRNLREMLAVNCEKTDSLHDAFLREETIKEILQRMLKKEENGQKINNGVKSSLIMNGMNMLSALIEHNTAGTTPAILFENGELEQLNWVGGGPGEMRSIFDRQVWLPDTEKVAETLTAQKTTEMVQVAIEDLEKDAPGSDCVWMLKLLSELANTNHLPTHNLLVEGFREANFKKLFPLVRKHPLAHIFHHQLRNIVTYSLFSNTGETVSPLIDYFLSECDLFTILKEGVYPLSNVPKIVLYSIRSFHIYLADVISRASKKAPHADLIAEYLKNSADWSGDGEQTVSQGLSIYWKKNKADELKAPSELRQERYQPATEFPEDIDSFNRFECLAEIPDYEPVSLPSPQLSNNVTLITAVSQDGMQINLKDKDPEEAFENACRFIPAADLFAQPSLLLHRRTSVENTQPEEEEKPAWPGEEPSFADTANTSNGSADDFWDQPSSGRFSNGSNSSSEEWPTLNNSTEKDDSFKETFVRVTDFANFESAMEYLDNSVKAGEQSTSEWIPKATPSAAAGWTADFSKAPPPANSDSFPNESET